MTGQMTARSILADASTLGRTSHNLATQLDRHWSRVRRARELPEAEDAAAEMVLELEKQTEIPF